LLNPDTLKPYALEEFAKPKNEKSEIIAKTMQGWIPEQRRTKPKKVRHDHIIDIDGLGMFEDESENKGKKREEKAIAKF